MPGPLPFGTETLVNTTEVSGYTKATTVALTNGKFMVLWSGDDEMVKGQLFNANGSKAGGEFNVSAENEEWSRDVNAVELANGKIAVTWAGMDDTASDTDNGSIQGRIINANGTPAGSTFTANATATGRQEYANIAATKDGGFFITWTDGTIIDNKAAYNISGQFFTAAGVKTGGEIVVNASIGGPQRFSEMTKLSNGNVIVVWADEGRNAGDTTSTVVRAQLYKPDGSKLGAEFIVPTELKERQTIPDVVALKNGKFAVIWGDDSGLVDGQVAGGTVRDTGINGVVAQIFNADGSKSGDDFLVNTRVDGAQTQAKVTALKDGGFVVVWNDWTPDPDDNEGYSIRAQVLNADGSKRGEEFAVNTATAGNQEEPQVTGLADGRFAVVWEDNSSGASQVKMQIFDPRTAAVDLKGTIRGDDFVGTAFKDMMRGGKANDVLDGAGGADQLFGDVGKDKILGGLGQDKMTGGKGADDFFFRTAAEANKDKITDFKHKADDLDFSAFMEGGKFIGSKAFGGTGAAELRYIKATGVLSVDLDGDGTADFSLTLLNKAVLTADDFIL